MITFHNITVLYSGYLWEVRISTIHFVQCTTSTFSLNTFHLYHQFSLVASINMRLELLNSLFSHLDVNYHLLNVFFFHYKVIHWWNAVPIDILTSVTIYFYLCVNFCNWFVCVIISLHACVVIVLLYMCVVIFVCLHACCICVLCQGRTALLTAD